MLALLSLSATRPSADVQKPRDVVLKAMAEAGDIDAQAEALTRLAWPEQGPPDSQVAALARAELIDFGSYSVSALRSAVLRVDPIYSADVVVTLIQARLRVREGTPAGYVSALEDTLWLGSPDARRVVIPELASHRFTPALMACVDTAIQFPGLQSLVVRSLGEFRDHRARFYLEEVLLEGPEELRSLAAGSLARIGGLALAPLHDAALSPDPGIRLPAIRALTPVSRIDDLTTLYEYLGRFPQDDETLREEVRSRSALLEAALEQRMDIESASPSPFE
jgi:hypothetical protein